MKKNHPIILLAVSILLFTSWKTDDGGWASKKHKGYTLYYTSTDKGAIKEYHPFIANGMKAVKTFFHSSYKKEFSVFIHPDRRSLDSTWQKDWTMPGFRSECWMVASGVAARLDMISPQRWDKQSCEHIYSETTHTQQLITHELVHVYHGQQNISPDFSDTEGIDWFVEGLATYASGQCDASRMAEVKKAISENKVPKGLDAFWTGKIKYGLSGSVVMYIDQTFGRNKLNKLLPLNKKSEILSALSTTEPVLLAEWKKYMQQLMSDDK